MCGVQGGLRGDGGGHGRGRRQRERQSSRKGDTYKSCPVELMSAKPRCAGLSSGQTAGNLQSWRLGSLCSLSTVKTPSVKDSVTQADAIMKQCFPAGGKLPSTGSSWVCVLLLFEMLCSRASWKSPASAGPPAYLPLTSRPPPGCALSFSVSAPPQLLPVIDCAKQNQKQMGHMQISCFVFHPCNFLGLIALQFSNHKSCLYALWNMHRNTTREQAKRNSMPWSFLF